MKLLKKILLAIWILMMLLIGLILLCTWKPELTDRIADFLYPNRNGEYQVQEAGEAGQTDNHVMGDDALQTGNLAENGQQPDTGAGLPEEIPGTSNVVLETPSPEYDPPSQSQMEIPDQVAGKSGYQEIQENQEQVEEEAADQLEQQLGTGETGDGLSFDELFYPYYYMLDDKGQHLYRQIYANASVQNASFAPVEEVRASELKNVFEAVYNDHPELFWVETAYSCKCRRNGQCVEITLAFNRTVQDMGRAQSEFEANAQALLANARGAAGSYEKEKLVHDALIQKIVYQASAEMNQSAYSGIVTGQTVCAGYARAFQYLMQQLEIPCYYCTGYAGENHAWNIILLDDGYYNVDVTWDDTEGANYDYFNKTDQDYAGTHLRRDLSVYLPACNGQQYRSLEQSGQEGSSTVWESQEAVGPAAENGTSPADSTGLQTSLRSLEEIGYTEDQVCSTLADYYVDCYSQLTEQGVGEHTFYSVVSDEELLQELYQSYQTDQYRQGYMEQAMTAVGAQSCQMRLTAEPLKDGRYLIAHSVILTGS